MLELEQNRKRLRKEEAVMFLQREMRTMRQHLSGGPGKGSG